MKNPGVFVPDVFECMYCHNDLSNLLNVTTKQTEGLPGITQIQSDCPICKLQGHLLFVTPAMLRKRAAAVKASAEFDRLRNQRNGKRQRRAWKSYQKQLKSDNKRLGKRIQTIGAKEAFMINGAITSGALDSATIRKVKATAAAT